MLRLTSRPTVLLVLVCLLAFAFVPSGAAHHADTPEQAEYPPVGPFTLYHHYLMVGQELERLQALQPDLMRYKVIGQSVLGLDIYGVEVTNFGSSDPPIEDRYRLYFDGSIHSNEQLGMEAAMDILRWLIEDYETDPQAKRMVDERRTFIVPLVNPDGNIRDSRQNANGVDLNRNFPAGFGGPGSNARGPAPLSEPETQAVADFLDEVRPHYSNSFHTGTLMLLFPYGNYERTDENLANVQSPDHEMFTSICSAIQHTMDAEAGRDVPCGQVFSTIYPASGTTVDYVYERFGSVSFTFEVDDEQNLWLSAENIRSRLGETWASVEHAYENVHRYGAYLVIQDVTALTDGDRVTGIEVTVRNEGMGRSKNVDFSLAVEGGGVALGRVADIGAGNETTWTFEPSKDTFFPMGATGGLALEYNKTLYKGFRDSLEVNFQVVRDEDGQPAIVLLDEGASVLAVDGAAATPGPGPALLLLAVLGGFVVRRRATR